MAVTSETSSVEYVTNGVTTVFPTGYRFLKSSELKVRYTPTAGVETLLAEGVGYTVAGEGLDAGGTVTTLAALAAGKLVIERTVPLTQTTAFRTQGTFRPEVHEDAFDEAVFRDQQLERRVKALESAGAAGDVVAGDGLTSSGLAPMTLAVGAGDGILVTADAVSVDFAAGAPAIIGAGAGSAGLGLDAARGDHAHQVATAAPVALVVGSAGGTGASGSLAKADHVHPIPQAGAGDLAAVDAGAPSAGATGVFADGGHKHTVTVAAPVELTDTTTAIGGATSLACSNHQHAHGNRAGGTLHAVATAADAGFMSAVDKSKLDGLSADDVTDKTGQTTNAVATLLMQWTPTNQTAEEVELTVTGRKQGAVDAGGYRRRFVVSRFDGVTSLVGTVDTIGADKETNAAWDISVTIASPAVQVMVTGVAATVIDWHGRARRVVAP